jgi:lipid-binding SYLF domain-containing protein
MMAKVKLLTGALCLALFLAGCSTAPEKPEGKVVLTAQVQEAISLFETQDPSIQTFFDKSYAYAVLPKIFKAALWIGGAGGRGEVYEKGALVGYCHMSQATLGFSFGGEFFREIIFFRNKPDLDKFRTGEFAFSAQAGGVAITAGAAAKADYKDGMAVFVMTDKGLMLDISLGGQKFNYLPK